MSKKNGANSDRAKLQAKFKNDRVRRFVLYNPLPTGPDEFDTVVKTFAFVGSSAATASISLELGTNTLSHTADSFNGAATNAAVTNIGRTYAKYRIPKYKIQYTVSPRSAIDTHMSVIHSPAVLGLAAGTSFAFETVTRDKSVYHYVPSNTKSPCMIHSSSGYSQLAVVGNQEYEQDDKYAGTSNIAGVFTDPAEVSYVTFHMGQTTGAAFTASTAPTVAVILTQYVRFYEKRA
jgi:hypothetical protein